MEKHHPKEVKLEAIRMYYEEGMSQRASILGVGSIMTSPLSTLMMVNIYRQLRG